MALKSISVWIETSTEGEGNEFINEVGIMGKIHHINVVRLLGFCADGLHRALVYNFFPNGSLQSFIFPPEDKDHFLGWEKLQHVALGIAKGIEYLHQGCNHPIIHFDINPHNVLLDHNFTPNCVPRIPVWGPWQLLEELWDTLHLKSSPETLETCLTSPIFTVMECCC